MSKGFEQLEFAQHHTAKAGGLETQLERSVFSDDPDAIEQIEARIAEDEVKRDHMKRVNALYNKGDAVGLAALGLDLEALRSRVATVGLSWVKAPYESYQLTNLGARIRSDRERITEIQRRATWAAKADANGGMLVEDVGDYARVTFAEKPPRATLDALKAAGFYWGAGHWIGRRDALPAEVTS